jgi:hypothetical protein
MILAFTSLASAQVPDPDLSYATSATSEPVSLVMLPNGSGNGFEAAQLYGGSIADATITVVLRDESGMPVVGFPAEDVFLICGDADDVPACAPGMVADADTDASGTTTFTQPLLAGGSGAGAQVMIGTWPTPELPIEFLQGDLYHFNSQDLNGDLIVNLSDIVTFTGDYFGAYTYRADLHWDGTHNLADVVVFAVGLGAACP